jgi:hypothetical protein
MANFALFRTTSDTSLQSLHIPLVYSMTNSHRLSQLKSAIGAINQVLTLITSQLNHVQYKPKMLNSPPTVAGVSEAPAETLYHSLKPSTPNDFTGDRNEGWPFLNSCDLYFALAPHRFADDQAKILWAFLFMKGDRAAQFVNQELRSYCRTGVLCFESWQAFVAIFVARFCPRNEVQTTRIKLETPSYFQGCRTVEEYVDHFRELVDQAHYLEGAHIVLKFRQGLHPHIQDQVACRPSD